MVSRHDQLIN